jgi:ATP-dependent DNA helicase RecQ
VFSINKDELTVFEISYPDLEPVIKGLLRSYEGIFDYPSAIYENQLAGFIKKEVTVLKSELKKLQQFGIIEYHPQKDKPQLRFLRNRINTEDFTINQNNLSKRKMAFEKRLQAIVCYIKTKACRSKTIANYFNDVSVKPCGVCDNCINEKEIVISKTEFENIVAEIKKFTDVPVSSNVLLKNINTFKKEKVWKVLNYLQAENKISISLEGLVIKSKHI